MKRPHLLVIPGLLLAAAASAQAPAPPPGAKPAGNYIQSCTNISVVGGVMRAKCSPVPMVDATLKLPCPGPIDNVNGRLVCAAAGVPRPGPLPAGSYAQTCTGAHVEVDKLMRAMLRADCRRRDGSMNNTSLQLPCPAPIDNIDGVLTCMSKVAPPAKPIPPPGK